MAITTIGLTGFEHGFIGTGANAGGGLFDAAPGSGWSAGAASPRNGNYCAHLVAPANTATRLANNFAVAQTKVVMRFAVKVSSRPSSGSAVIAHLATAATQLQILISSAGVLSALVGAGTAINGPTIDTASWHVIELQADVSAATITLSWKVDGVAQTQASFTGGPTTLTAMGLGTTATTNPGYTADYDDVIVGTWATAATDWYGDGQVIAQLPGSDGTHATVTSLSPGDAGTAYLSTATAVFSMVDDPPGTGGWTATRSTTDNIALRTATVGAYAEIVPVPVIRSGSANAVKAIVSYSSSATQTNLAACDVRNSAGAVSELWGLTGGVGQAYSVTANNFKSGIVTRPAAGWTAAEVNAIRFRFGGCTSADISPVPTVQAMMLEVDWPVTTGTPINETIIDDFNRVDGSVYAGAGANVWEANGGSLVDNTTPTVATTASNQMAMPSLTRFVRSKVQLQSDFDLLYDIVAVPPSSLSFGTYFAMTGVGAAGYDGIEMSVAQASQADNWKLIFHNTNGSTTLLANVTSPRPIAGSTIWIARRGTTISVYHRMPGAQFNQITSITDARNYVPSTFALDLPATTWKIDNLRGGQLFTLAPAVETTIDDFNRADAVVDAGAGAAIWTRTMIDGTATAPDLRTISNALGSGAGNVWRSSYTKTLIDNSSGNCDIVVDCAAVPVAPNNEFGLWCLITNPGLSTFTGYIVYFSDGTWILRRVLNGVSQGNLNTAAGTLVAGDSIWFSKRGSALKVYKKASGGSYAQILSATDANHNPASGTVGIELSDSTQRWDNLGGGPLVTGPATLFGATAMPITVNRQVIGQRKTFSAVAMPVSFGAVTAGQIVVPATTYYGAVSAAYTVDRTTVGRRKTFGTVAVASSFGAVTDGRRKTFGVVARPSTFGATTVASRRTFGVVARASSFGAVTDGRRKTFSAVAMPTSFVATTSGIARARVLGAVSLVAAFGATTDGRRKTFGVVDRPSIFAATTVASRRTFAVVARATSFGAVTDGRRKTFSAVAMPASFAAVTDGRRRTFGVVARASSFAAATIGYRKTFGVIALPASFASTTVARRRTFSAVAMPTSFAAIVAARRQTFGVIAFPLTAPIDVRGIGFTGSKTYFGSIDLPVTLLLATKGIRRTFGQVALPLAFSAVTQGRRRTFSQLAMPLSFAEVTQGRRSTFGRTALPIVFAEVTVGRRSTFGKIDMALVMTEVTQGRRVALGRILMPLTFDKQTAGTRRAFGKTSLALLLDEASQGYRTTHGQIEMPLRVEFWLTGFAGSSVGGTVINFADAIYMGSNQVDAVYTGSNQIWTP